MSKGNNRNPYLRPFLKWAGGKRQLLPELRKYIPPKNQFNTYIEPFLGAGAVLFDLKPKKAIVNDSNSELINCYKVIRDDLTELIQHLNSHIENMKGNEQEYYYSVREWDRHPEVYDARTPVEKAARIIFLNKTCYNGLFRVNSQGQFNVPFGRYKKPNIFDEGVLFNVSTFLNEKDIVFMNEDFEKCELEASKKDFIYLDPPYDPISSSASFTGYDINGFDKKEQKRLKKMVDRLDKKGCKILLSNSYTPFIKDLYTGYDLVKISASRSVNSNATKRGKIDEILIKNRF